MKRRNGRLAAIGPPTVVFAIVLLIWYVASYLLVDPAVSFLLPAPHQVVTVAFGDPANLNELLVALGFSARVAMVGLVAGGNRPAVSADADVAPVEPTFAERLGWKPGSVVVILHVDDVGMSHASNLGAIEAMEQGVATS